MDTMDDLLIDAATTSPSSSPQHESASTTQTQNNQNDKPDKNNSNAATNPLHVNNPPLLSVNPFNILSGLVPGKKTSIIKSNSNRSVESVNGRGEGGGGKPVVADIETTMKYDHDVQVAKSMQMNKARRKQKQEQRHQHPADTGHTTRNPRHIITKSDVMLGLDALDQADDLRASGRKREALIISELALELLIGFLRSDLSSSSPSSSPSLTAPTCIDISRENVEARVLVALTAAEEMKKELETRAVSSTASSSSTHSQVSSLSNSLKVALGKVSTGIENGNNEQSIASSNNQPSNKRPSNGQSAGQATSSLPSSGRKTSTVRQKASSKTKKKGTLNAKTTSVTSTSAVSSSSSSLLNSQDPLVQTVKSELYIDQSQLQGTTWDDIAGLDEAKQALQEAAILPLLRPDLFSGLRRPRNVLLYGPPGTGKTMLVKAIAHESNCLLFICAASSLTSKWHGEGEKLLRTLFEIARQAAPSIIFVDEMDALLSKRKTDGEHEASRRFKTEFLTQMDGIVKKGGGGAVNGNGKSDIPKNLLVIGATNTPWDIDDAVLRRFPRRIYIPLPDSTTRKALLSKLLQSGDASHHNLSSSDTKAIVRRLAGFSGSDITSIAAEASFGPIRALGGMDAIRGARSSDIRPIERKDFDDAIDSATKSVSKNLLKQYETWKSEQQATA